ncbi:hypothetical protein HPB48_006585 [Haemaphysalis longicornis]|uniref:Uncharacterized protein n=1 Tax=Haemaphysalis longicornis TaxID=44386 RepID=A0A9J6GQK1_HAELO|nr:hypothetical protein HPB48_006585 [Haemaphysalis longicornis]
MVDSPCMRRRVQTLHHTANHPQPCVLPLGALSCTAPASALCRRVHDRYSVQPAEWGGDRAGSMGKIDDGTYRCPDGSSPERIKQRVISGVLGAASSVTSIQVANLLRLFKIPQVRTVALRRTSPLLLLALTDAFFSGQLSPPLHHFPSRQRVRRSGGGRRGREENRPRASRPKSLERCLCSDLQKAPSLPRLLYRKKGTRSS